MGLGLVSGSENSFGIVGGWGKLLQCVNSTAYMAHSCKRHGTVGKHQATPMRALKRRLLSGKQIMPPNITGKETVETLIEETFLAYNAARLREAVSLFVEKMLRPEVTIGMSFAGALTPAGLGASCIVPLIKAGFVDWIVATGANLYHDLHFAFNLRLHVGTPRVDDAMLRAAGVVRIYDVLLGFEECLLETDRRLREILAGPEFQKEMGTAEFHYLLGRHCALEEEKHGLKDVSVLAAAYRAGVPVYTSSPGDSSIGMNMACLALQGSQLRINPAIDVNETAAIVLNAKRSGGRSGVVLWGGGSPKNFVLQTEPQIQEVLGIAEHGHDYFIQFTDARPDTGGLSGATPSEAVSWGKVDPRALPDTVVCYTDSTLAMPLFVHYALAKHGPRPLRRLYDKRDHMVEFLKGEFYRANKSLTPRARR